MLIEFEREYMDKYWKLRTAQWNNYIENKNFNLNDLDAEIYNFIKQYIDKIHSLDRKSHVAVSIIKKDFIDKNPDVSILRNQIDNVDNYSFNIPEFIKSNKYKYKLALSKNMKEDVIRLMKVRNYLSNQLEFNSYPELIFATEEIDKNNIIRSLNRFLDCNLSKAKKIIKKYDIKWETWFSDLNKIGIINKQYNPVKLIKQLLEMIGYDEILEGLKIYFTDKGISGYAAQLSQNEIRIAVKPIESLYLLGILFHELGHAVSYSLNGEKGIFKILQTCQDEGMAVVMEYIALNLLELNSKDKEKMYEIMTLEYVRLAISSLFEFDLWENLESAEELYTLHYCKLDLKINEPSFWVLDSFRSIDPVYTHNYVIGALLAEEMIYYLESLYGDNYKKWGYWLHENIYKEGRGKPFSEKIRLFGNLI
jgi:hypothetical protein